MSSRKSSNEQSQNSNISTNRKRKNSSSQESPNKRLHNPPVLSPQSLVNSQRPKGFHSLPRELIGQIVEEVMSNKVMDTKARNTTRSLPAIVTSLKCKAGHHWRERYLFALDVCNKSFVYSLHFGNNWKVSTGMDDNERQLVQNIVVKFVPVDSYQEHIAREGPQNPLGIQRYRDENKEYYHPSLPSRTMLNQSLSELPAVQSVQLEFKTFLPAYRPTFTGMIKVVESFQYDSKEFRLVTAMIEPNNNNQCPRSEDGRGWKFVQRNVCRIVIPEVSVMAGHHVGFVLTDENIWSLEDVTKQEILSKETMTLFEMGTNQLGYLTWHTDGDSVLRGCRWTWVFERV